MSPFTQYNFVFHILVLLFALSSIVSCSLSAVVSAVMEPNMTIGFNNSLTDDTVDIDSQSYLRGFFITFASMLYIEAAVQIYKKHKNDLEPLYIFELNTLVSIAMAFLCTANKWFNIWKICPITQWLIHYSRLNVYVGILISQLDRFLALYLHMKYKERVTPRRALVSSFFSF